MLRLRAREVELNTETRLQHTVLAGSPLRLQATAARSTKGAVTSEHGSGNVFWTAGCRQLTESKADHSTHGHVSAPL